MKFGLTALLISLGCVSIHAAPRKPSDRTPNDPAAMTSRRFSSANVPLIDQPLRLADFAGMQPRQDLRNKLSHVSGFVQNQPVDGDPATESTEVWIGRTTSTLYFVFLCHDRNARLIRGHLSRREDVLSDDGVSVILDPFEDRRLGVAFRVNPAGVQSDSSWIESKQPDYSYDTVWDSDGRVTSQGWMALIAIPFRSLRFHNDQTNWGVVFVRFLPRNSETDYWPRISTDITGVLSQEGTLHGIEGVTGSHNLQLNPYTIAQNERRLVDIDPTNPYFSARRFQMTQGGEAKYIIKDSIVVDATLNPDFSDTESDQPQFTVDQRYPVYFPELRPFFLENANYFDTPITLLYTRNIVRPQYGVRLTGKVSGTNIGMLMTDDRQPGLAVAPGDPLYQKHSAVAVARVSHDLGEGSSLGAMYTDQEFGHGWNRIGGVDFVARVNKHWTAWAQGLASSTRADQDNTTPPDYSAGPAFDFDLQRSGHAFNMFESYLDVSTGFQTQLGFIQASNFRRNRVHAQYQWYPQHSIIQSFGLESDQRFAFDHQGNRVFRYLSYDPFFLLPRKLVIAPVVGQNSDTLNPADYDNLPHFRNFTENFVGLVMRGAPLSQFNFKLETFRSGNVNYNPAAGRAPSLLNQETVSLLFTVQPLHPLTVDNTYLLDRNHSAANNAFVYESQTIRSKVNYQFTRSLSARVIAEFDSIHVNPAETSLLRTRQFASQALLTWLPHPGTAIYIGYSNDLQNLDRGLCNRLQNGLCDPDNTTPPRAGPMLNDGKQIFIKASYLFRF